MKKKWNKWIKSYKTRCVGVDFTLKCLLQSRQRFQRRSNEKVAVKACSYRILSQHHVFLDEDDEAKDDKSKVSCKVVLEKDRSKETKA